MKKVKVVKSENDLAGSKKLNQDIRALKKKAPQSIAKKMGYKKRRKSIMAKRGLYANIHAKRKRIAARFW